MPVLLVGFGVLGAGNGGFVPSAAVFWAWKASVAPFKAALRAAAASWPGAGLGRPGDAIGLESWIPHSKACWGTRGVKNADQRKG